MGDTRKVVIRITGMDLKEWDDGGTTVTLEDGKTKYQFSSTKKDGSITKAQEGYDELKFRIGDVVTAEVSEEPATFTDKAKGKEVHYTKRRIMFFYTDKKEMEEIQTAPAPETATQRKAPAPQPESEYELSQITRIEEKIDKVLSILQPRDSKPETVRAMPAPQKPTPPAPTEDGIPIIPGMEDELDEIRIEDVPF